MILVVGLSPAWQRTLLFGEFNPGWVNRAQRVTETASGKVVNVARVASILGARIRLLTVAGGVRGRWLEAELKRQGLGVCSVPVKAETRVCQTLLVRGLATELVEEAVPLTATEVRKVRRAFDAELRRARVVVLTGSVPRGCGTDFYARLVRESNLRGVPVLVDAQREQLMNALRQKPFLVKVNRDELAAASGARGRTAAVRRPQKFGPEWVVVTQGSQPVRVFQNRRVRSWTFLPPRVEVRNPIGSGDAMLAGIAVALWRGRAVLDAVRFGIACGAANAMRVEPGFLRVSDVRRLCSTHNRYIPIV
jgi:tagatose 6-phosphate kinase